MAYVILRDVNGHVATFDQDDFTKEVEKMIGMPFNTIAVLTTAFGPQNLGIINDPQAVKDWMDAASTALTQSQVTGPENGEESPDES